MTAALDEDIKTAALEALVPRLLEQHFAMNRAQLITYEHIRSEIQAHIEARRSQFAFKTVAPKNTSVQRMWTALRQADEARQWSRVILGDP